MMELSQADIDAAYDAYYEHEKEKHEEAKNKSIKCALKERCIDEDNRCLNIAERLFYTFKYIVCALLMLEPKKKHYAGKQYLDTVFVAEIDYTNLYAGWEATYATVGYGMFNNWYYNIENDGDWCM